MRSIHGYAILALTLTAAAITPARAQFGGGGFGGGGLGAGLGGGLGGGGLGGRDASNRPPVSVDHALYTRLNQYQADLSIQSALYRDRVKALDTLRGDFAPGSPQVKQAQQNLDRVKQEMERLQGQIEVTQKAIADQQRAEYARLDAMLAPYQHAVTVDLQDSTVRQAAEALSKVSGMEILVDESVPESTRLKVRAKGVALGAILEAIAEPAGLELAPSGKGIKITTWPSLKVNDDVTIFTGQHAPWAEEFIQRWGFRPSFGAGQSFRVRGGAPAGTGLQPIPTVPGGGFPGLSAAPGGGYPGLPAPDVTPGALTAPAPVGPQPAHFTGPEAAATPAVAPPGTVEVPSPTTVAIHPVNTVAAEPLALVAMGSQNVVALEPAESDPHGDRKVLALYRFQSGGPRRVSITPYEVKTTAKYPVETALPRAGTYQPATWSLQSSGTTGITVLERHQRVRGAAVLVRVNYRLEGDRLIPQGLAVTEAPAEKPLKKTAPSR